MITKKKVSVKIYGNEYTVIGDTSEDYIQYLAEKIDEIMKEIGGKNKRYSPTMTAVLTALNLADTLHKVTEEFENLQEELGKIKEEYAIPVEQLNNANAELEVIKDHYKAAQEASTKNQMEITKLSSENITYKDELKNLKFELDVSKNTSKDLQNKLFESQIELLKTKKELENLKLRTKKESI